MNYIEKNHPTYGKCLFADNGIIEIGIPLEFGLRIGHFSFVGGDNVFFEQPKDLKTFTTAEGWQIRGGHRLWLAPESGADYFPDNAPIQYKIDNDTVILTQQKDPWLNVIKEIVLHFDENRMHVEHRVTNVGEDKCQCSLWAISSVAAGGKQTICFERRDNGYDPWHKISMWDYTNLGDPRVKYSRDEIVITHTPLDERDKIGVSHPYGPIKYENGNTIFLKNFQIHVDKKYPDGNMSYETFCGRYMMELESLSPLFDVLPNQTVSHTEVWELLKKS